MKLWQWDNVRGVRVLRLPLYPDHSTSPLRRLVNYTSFATSSAALGAIKTLGFRADVIFAYFAPLTMGLTAAWFKRLHAAPLVYWITDLWPENLGATGVRMGRALYTAVQRFEEWSYEQAAVICVDSPGFKSNLVGKKVSAHKVHIVPEWADENLFFPVAKDKELAQAHSLLGKFNILYGGNLGTVQHLETVIEAAARLKDLPQLQFVFVGDGNDMTNLKNLAELRELENVRFIPRQPIEEIHRYFALADVLLVHLKKEPIFKLQLPSKVIAYLACGRPILCAIPGAAAEIVSKAQAGVLCPSEDPSVLAEQARKLYAMPITEREALGQNGRRVYLEKYTRRLTVGKIADILDSAVAQHAREKAIACEKGVRSGS